MENIWIIGAGRFGSKAARKLHRKNRDNKITVVDRNPNRLNKLSDLSLITICSDGIDFLLKSLITPDCPDWIVPAIPVHVAHEWIRRKLDEQHRFEALAVPQELAAELPNPVRGESGEIYVSNADFICPEDCPAPAEICTHTGMPRPMEIYLWLQSLAHPNYFSVVVRSRQLAPGVGGYSARDLFKALDAIHLSKSPVLLSTACRCHGVTHAFKKSGSAG